MTTILHDSWTVATPVVRARLVFQALVALARAAIPVSALVIGFAAVGDEGEMLVACRLWRVLHCALAVDGVMAIAALPAVVFERVHGELDPSVPVSPRLRRLERIRGIQQVVSFLLAIACACFLIFVPPCPAAPALPLLAIAWVAAVATASLYSTFAVLLLLPLAALVIFMRSYRSRAREQVLHPSNTAAATTSDPATAASFAPFHRREALRAFPAQNYTPVPEAAPMATRPSLANLGWKPEPAAPPAPSHPSIAREDALCVICLDDYDAGDRLTWLPCRHHFHAACAAEWAEVSPLCPVCKRNWFAPAEDEEGDGVVAQAV
ncbi:hypothetical protein H9P43_001734 [Blastocladiella emersonii ATCC 22665]|nr:hypothetical protein H9P43_001734 [Blastocladiella emersonii ATCC 22665]